jgi:hypothetical protein
MRTSLPGRVAITNASMGNERMQSAIKGLQNTMIVMAHIEKRQSEHISELLEFRTESEKLHMQSEKFRTRTEQNLSGVVPKTETAS